MSNLLVEDKAVEILREFASISGNRGNWEAHWQEIAERIYPSHYKLFTSNTPNQAKGEKRNENVFDSTASIALQRFGAILDSLLTPRNQTWHKLGTDNPLLAKNRQVKLYFDDVTKQLFKYRYSPRANFSAQNQLVYLSLGAYGTGTMYIDKLDEGGLRYKNIFLGQMYYVENHQGIIDRVYRRFNMTARQLLLRWGDKVGEAVKDKGKTNIEHEFEIIHCVKPREDAEPGRLDYRGMPYASYYVLVQGKILLEEDGYSSWPYPSPRYEQSPGEVFGRSPAMQVLPAIKTLNEQKKTVLKQGHRTVDPILLVHDDGIADGFNMRPGAMNVGGITADGRPLVQPLPVGRIDIGKDLMDDERAIINDAFLVSLFQILMDQKIKTATEVLEMAREKGILIAPTIGRQETEYLSPMIEREIDLLDQQGLLPKMPQILMEAKGEYNVVYDSPLSRAQKAEEAAGLMRAIDMAVQVFNATQDPAPLDHFEWDEIVPDFADIQGIPARWMKNKEQILAVREGRAAQAQQQMDIEAGPAAAAVLKTQQPKG